MNNEDIDRLIAEKVMGWEYFETFPPYGFEGMKRTYGYYQSEGYKFMFDSVGWRPTTDISQAFMVVEKVDDCLHLKQHGKEGKWEASFCGYGQESSCADTPALAICKAAISNRLFCDKSFMKEV